MGMGMDPPSPANRGWGWGWTPDPRQIGDGTPIPIPGQIGDADGDGDRGFRALTQTARDLPLRAAGSGYYTTVVPCHLVVLATVWVAVAVLQVSGQVGRSLGP